MGARIIIDDRAESATTIVVTTAAKAAEDHSPLRDVGNHADRTGDGSGDRADQDVAILHVRQFMRHHSRRVPRG